MGELRTSASGQGEQIDNTDKVHRDLADYKLAAGAEAQLADEWKARAEQAEQTRDELAEALRPFAELCEKTNQDGMDEYEEVPVPFSWLYEAHLALTPTQAGRTEAE